MNNTNIQNFAPSSRIWIYQANEPFQTSDIPMIESQLAAFAKQWVCHSEQLSSGAELLHDRFVVLTVDESQLGASGCSIDSSVTFVKQLGAQYNRDLLDRMRFSFIDKNGDVQTVSKDDFASLYSSGEINNETIVFDPLIKTVGELENNFQKKLTDSWHARFV